MWLHIGVLNNMDKKWRVLLGTGIAMMIVAIDFTIVNTCLANIQRDLHASINQLQWVMAGFGIFFSTLLVTAGRLSDIKGRRKFMYVGVVGFGLASLSAGLSTTPEFLIAMRIIQGICGAAIYPTGMALTSAAFPEHEQGKALGIYSSIVGVGLAVGPVLGSAIVTFLSWRWIFFINLPVVILSLIICFPVIKESKHPEASSVDWPGAITLIMFLATMVFGITEAPFYGWTSTLIVGSFVISLISLGAFISIERGSKTPLLPIKLFMNATFFLGVLVFFVTVSLAWSILFLMPLYLHSELGFSTGKVGLLLLPMTLMTVIAPVIISQIYESASLSITLNIPFILSVVGLLLFTFLEAHGPIALIIISFLIFGCAWGAGNIALPLSLSHLPSSQDHGLVSGGLVTLMNVYGIFIFTVDIVIFRYAKQTSFIHGLHSACYTLLGIVILFWIIALIVNNRMKKSLS